jgi:glycosyltransferase involved in cell wall biosynthesis
MIFIVPMNVKSKMKIGIDAKWLFTGHVSGKHFTENILPELFSSHPEIEWHIFLDKKDKHFAFPFKSRMIIVHYVWAGLNMVSNLFVLPGYAKQLKLDAVLFQTFSPKGRSFKSIVFIHDVLFRNYPEYFTWREKLYFKPLTWTIPWADRIVTTTEHVKNELKRLRYAKSSQQQIDIAPLGVSKNFRPIDQFDKKFLKTIAEKYGLPSRYLLFVGRLNRRKNIQGLLRSLNFVNDKSICLVIAGAPSWKKPPITRLLTKKDIKPRIILIGPVPGGDELAAIYAMSTVFCFPSFAEGFGLPPVEAMASGVPVIVSNTTSMPEVCGNAALFVDPRDPKSIAEKINQLLDDVVVYRQKSKEGMTWAAQYTWKRTAEKIMKAIFDCVDPTAT